MYYCYNCEKNYEKKTHQHSEKHHIVKVVECYCGNTVHLNNQGHDTNCEGCGQRYNAFGQKIKSSAPRF